MDPNRPDRPLDAPLGGPPAMTPPPPRDGVESDDRPSGRWPNEPHGRYYDYERAWDLRGSVTGWRLLPALLFRPTEFMLAHAVHVRFSQVFMIMWFFGAMLVIDGLEYKSVAGSAGASTALSYWPGIWGAAIAAGLVRGMIYYWLWGLWFRARLHFCGVRRVEGRIAGRVFAFLHFPFVLASFCYYAAASLAFDDFDSYSQTEHLGWIIAGFSLIGVQMYTSFLAYASVRGVFNAHRGWSLLWFLFLPMIARLVLVGGILLIAWFSAAAPKPDTDSPKIARTATMTMQYPGNWVAEIARSETGPPTLIELQPTGHDAHIAVEILFYNSDLNPVAETEAWLVEVGFELSPDPTPLTAWGVYRGNGFEYRSTKDGNAYVLRMFFSKLAHDGWLEVREIIHADSAERLEPGLEFLRQSTVVRDPATLSAEVSNPKWMEAGGVRFQAPANWWRTRWIQEDPQPGRAADFRLRAESGQASVFSVLGYSTSPGARSELSGTLDNLGITGRMDDERPLDQWLGLDGIGIDGIDRADAEGERDRRVRVIVAERVDGTYVEVLQIDYLDSEPLTDEGFALIEASFEVDARAPVARLPEPAASPEAASDSVAD